VAGKIFNARTVLERAKRDHPLNIDEEKFRLVSNELKASVKLSRKETDVDKLRGIEGNAASMYFSVFDDLILQNKKQFTFLGRSKRPPIGRVNALLSFAYTLLAHDYHCCWLVRFVEIWRNIRLFCGSEDQNVDFSDL
ncbi:MAG: CRISPR-associated endonuclease Cas1, partial [Selenomonas sp.]|nr:CRISPR-associated endonuclease Cas1 [Selenomonas sp.]